MTKTTNTDTNTATARQGAFANHTVVGIVPGNPKRSGSASAARWAASLAAGMAAGVQVHSFTAPGVQGGLTSADLQWGMAYAKRCQFVLAAPGSALLAAYTAHAKTPTVATHKALLAAWPKAAHKYASQGGVPLPAAPKAAQPAKAAKAA